jgi:molybdenum cofactor cytidylyltransferase
MQPAPTVVVLAAGRGSRFDGGVEGKLGQPLDGSTVLGTTLAGAIASRLHVVVVTTSRFAALVRESVAARDVVVLPEAALPQDAGPELGMGRSIAAGVEASPGASGWLVLPGDMPRVGIATLLAVARAIEHHPVAFAQHAGRRGHPVGFAAPLYQELAGLRGDEGARRIIARYPAVGVEVDDPGIHVDIDTLADLTALTALGGPDHRLARATAYDSTF